MEIVVNAQDEAILASYSRFHVFAPAVFRQGGSIDTTPILEEPSTQSTRTREL
ncbi:hypothetical protein FHX59_000922 [Paraburkholderia silvatlantica]|uniref:Uncharacterized protein n=1 Tax=Paraburkholderia silvatlantica TaxID=321895 RepID=A0ABR6FGI1_9BURK|nr:hypothetical protein [Paraburkholderia silvatlantica]MBB2926515.1 hypothetical protein [Paraburkholderia silvatlantica]